MSEHQGAPGNDITFCFSGKAPHANLLLIEVLSPICDLGFKKEKHVSMVR